MISYTITVENTGNVTLTGLPVTDTRRRTVTPVTRAPPDAADNVGDLDLDASSTWTRPGPTPQLHVLQADIDAGSAIVNTDPANSLNSGNVRDVEDQPLALGPRQAGALGACIRRMRRHSMTRLPGYKFICQSHERLRSEGRRPTPADRIAALADVCAVSLPNARYLLLSNTGISCFHGKGDDQPSRQPAGAHRRPRAGSTERVAADSCARSPSGRLPGRTRRSRTTSGRPASRPCGSRSRHGAPLPACAGRRTAPFPPAAGPA